MHRNINIEQSDFPNRLKTLREERRLTKSDLAARAHLSTRTVQDLEAGKRARIQEKTLILLAEALEVPMEDLVNHIDEATSTDQATEQATAQANTKGNGSRFWATVSITLLCLATVATIVWSYAQTHATWEVDGHQIIGRDGVAGLELWRETLPVGIKDIALDPWRNNLLLVHMMDQPAGGTPLIALNRRNGKTAWKLDPDLEMLKDAFGEEILSSGNMRLNCYSFADLQGDGTPELIAVFVHSLYYPTAVCVVDESGARLHQYCHKGHIYDVCAFDLDGDGRQEVITAGCNNAEAYNGAMITILDADHFHGASVDALASPESTLPDSCRVRIVFPQYPHEIMEQLGGNRLHAYSLHVSAGTDAGGPVISTSIATGQRADCLIVDLDRELNLLSSKLGDAFKFNIHTAWPESLEINGPLDPEWRQSWLGQRSRFEGGHWPPAGAVAQE